MKSYNEIYSALLELCKNEGLRLVEAELRNPKVIYFRFKEGFVINTKCEKYPKVR